MGDTLHTRNRPTLQGFSLKDRSDHLSLRGLSLRTD
jgi:hypothetical protein